MDIAFTTVPTTTDKVQVVAKVNGVGEWDQIPLTDVPAALVYLQCILDSLVLVGGAIGIFSIGLSSVMSISRGSVAQGMI